MKSTLNLAHRGFSGKYPENSPIAFSAALNIEGCDGFESDVHLTLDNEPVIIHDPTLERTTNGKGSVISKTYKELKALDCGSWFDSKFKGQKILHLDELIEIVLENNLVLNLEIKNYEVFYKDIEEIVINRIKKLNSIKSVFLSSFNHISMGICKNIEPSIKVGLLYNHSHLYAEKYAAENNIDAIHPRFHGLFYPEDLKLTDRAHKLGVKVNTWTVNEKEDMQKCLKLGVDSMITNYPDLLASLIK